MEDRIYSLASSHDGFFDRAPYTVALVPGAGLSEDMERDNHALNPMGKLIIEIAARRYFDKKVAFIIVSGG